jgi:hypothetical protein
MMAVLGAGAAALGWLWYSADKQVELGRVALGIFGALTCVALIGSGGRRLREIMRPVTIQIDAGKVTLSRRMDDRIGHEEWQQAWITGLRVVAAGWNEALQREDRVELWLTNGHGAMLYRGPRATVAALAAALRDALGVGLMGVDQAKPRRGPSRRSSEVVTPSFLEFTFRAPVFPWTMLATLPLAIGLAIVSELIVFRVRGNRLTFMPADQWQWPLARLAAFSFTLWVSLVAGCRRLRRTKHLSLINGKLVVIEVALRSPLREEWPMQSFVGFEVTSSADSAAVELVGRLGDGRAVTLITGERLDDLQWVRESLVRTFVANGIWRTVEPVAPAAEVAVTPVSTPEPPHPQTVLSDPGAPGRPGT